MWYRQILYSIRMVFGIIMLKIVNKNLHKSQKMGKRRTMIRFNKRWWNNGGYYIRIILLFGSFGAKILGVNYNNWSQHLTFRYMLFSISKRRETTPSMPHPSMIRFRDLRLNSQINLMKTWQLVDSIRKGKENAKSHLQFFKLWSLT